MSIYATLWHLRFPRTGDDYVGCDWVDVMAQGVPAHVGTPTPGYGYEDGDPFGDFLPAPILVGTPEAEDNLRAVVFVTGRTKKGTSRAGQEYESPLLVLTGAEYAAMSFEELHRRLGDALRAGGSRVTAQAFMPGEPPKLIFDDGTAATQTTPAKPGEPSLERDVVE